MFVDKAKIFVQAGNGGNGSVSFHREKYIAAGGPDGGDGGRGGNIVLRIDNHMSTLMDFRYKRKYAAGTGADGTGKNKSGKDGDDLIIRVPRGTLVRDAKTNAIMRDMSDDEDFILAKGGRGGWGNRHFATPQRQAPRFAKAGTEGEKREVILELKLLADVGLVGFPNVGKSTILSVVSKATPKIADYHFTTLSPNLGVVYLAENVSFVLADIPGIIEGAAEGAGLGHDFLRHVDRCRLLIHVVDISGSEGRDPIEDFEAINEELKSYDAKLASRPQLVAGNKSDIADDREKMEDFKKYVEGKGYPFFEISAASHKGVRELMQAAAAKLKELPPIIVYESEYVPDEERASGPESLEIHYIDGVWDVQGEWLERLMRNVNFGDYESRMYFDRTLRNNGVFERLESEGVEEGDLVRLKNLEFEYKY